MLKKIVSFTIAALFFCMIPSALKALPVNADAAAEIAMELSTGTVLEERNADSKLPMASTTKIMTAIIIIEDCNLDDVLTVPNAAVGVEGSSIYLKKGEEIDVRDLLYGLMLRSGNDSATALAMHHSGSIEKFVEVMNERAQKIGAENTHFKNPSGLPDGEHFTTARDLCNIACYAMRNSIFKELVSTKSYHGKYRSYSNKNKMLYNYEGANGVKTGYTLSAGRCLVTSAERNGMDVVTVVLNCPDMYERSAELLNTCFSEYQLINLSENAVFMCDRVLCKLDKSTQFITKQSSNPQVKTIADHNVKKIKKGEKIGELQIYGENNLIFRANLYSIMDK